MYFSERGEDASLQKSAAEGKGKAKEVQNNRGEDRKLFDINSLPPGYRFNPTDIEIIVYYLRKKVDHQPLPPNKIIQVNLYDYDPEELAARYEPINKDENKDEWFYFTPRDRKYPNGQRPNRSVRDGYWKATGVDKEIRFEDEKVGYRKVLVFYRGSAPHGVKTNWIMHEFKVVEPPEPQTRIGVNDMRLDDCVLCRVYRKDDKGKDRKRSRDECGNDESGSSRSKIPRLDQLDPYPDEANNQLTVGGGGGMDSVQERINYQYNPFINSNDQALQNQQQQQQQQQLPEFANAGFPLQVLPPTGTGTNVSFHGQNNNLMQYMEFPCFDHSWGSEFHFDDRNIGNDVLYSTMDLKPSYMPRDNMGNTGSASTTDFNRDHMMRVNVGNANLDSTIDYKRPMPKR